MSILKKSALLGLPVLALFLWSRPASALGCKDVEQDNAASAGGGRTSDCEDIEAGNTSLKVVFSCLGKARQGAGAFQSLTLLKAAKHKSYQGSLANLTKGWILEINYGDEHQRWVFDEGTSALGATSARFGGKRKEVVSAKTGGNAVELAVDGDVTHVDVRYMGNQADRIPTRVTLGQSTFKCASGRFSFEGGL